MTFSIERLILIAQYSLWAGLALFVFSWWGATVARNVIQFRRMQQVDWLMLGIAIMAGATCLSRLLWLPGHFFQGINEPLLAAEWSRSIETVLGFTNIAVIVGLALHVKTAWTTGSKWLITAFLLIWVLLCLMVWGMVGGFSFRYIW